VTFLGSFVTLEHPMKKSLAAVLMTLTVVVMARAERPPQSREKAKRVVTATVKKITTKEDSYGGDGVITHYTAELLVDSVEKGDAVKAGDTISVTWFHRTKRASKQLVGAFGHGYDIAEKDQAKFWLMDRAPNVPPGVWVVIYNKDGVEKIKK
jgi:hypothetical protein